MADIAGYDGQRTEFKVVGKPNLPGKLSYNLAVGKAKFGADATAPDMLHAQFLRSPYAYAVIKSMDISKAKALPGVVDILTWEDPDIKALAVGGYGGAPTPILDNLADFPAHGLRASISWAAVRHRWGRRGRVLQGCPGCGRRRGSRVRVGAGTARC